VILGIRKRLMRNIWV